MSTSTMSAFRTIDILLLDPERVPQKLQTTQAEIVDSWSIFGVIEKGPCREAVKQVSNVYC